MIWLLTFYCGVTTPAALLTQCEDMVTRRNADYYEYNSELFCMDWAEGLAKTYYNTVGYRLEYSCRATPSKNKIYVAPRRP